MKYFLVIYIFLIVVAGVVFAVKRKSSTASPRQQQSTSSSSTARLTLVVGLALFVILGACCWGSGYLLLGTNSGARGGVVYATTPATIVADYEFNIEADGPITVQYPGEEPIRCGEKRGYNQLPQPKRAGPKVFRDARDPENGHTQFRLYPVHNGR